MTDLIQEAKAALRRLGAAPRKKMSQNFMIQEENLEAVAEALDLREGETVFEIGPGLGFLTRCLLKHRWRVIAIEKDAKFVTYLKEVFNGEPLHVIESDILQLDLKKAPFLKTPVKITGNIPYHITSPLLEWLILQRALISGVVLMLQWEVALRLMARSGTKEWGPLSIFVQVYARVELVKRIPRSHFYPAPHVDSALVKLTFSDTPLYSIQNEEAFFGLVRRAFQKRRKTLLNSLKEDENETRSKQVLLRAFEKAGIDPRRRPETLSIPEWAALVGILS